MTKYISLKETANMIRETLKIEFPGIKFSVRSKSFSMGTAVDITWTDGPTQSEVDSAVGFYQGSSFDGMIDLSSPKYHTNEAGETIQYGAKYVQCQRTLSADFYRHMVAYAVATYAFTEEPEFEIVEAGKYSTAYVKANNPRSRFGNDWAQNFIAQLCHKTNAANMPVIPVAEVAAEVVTVEAEPVAVAVEETKIEAVAETISPVLAKLQTIDILNVTPLEALNILAELKKLAS